MISLENKEFLKNRFNIDSDEYTEEELDKKLDSIIAKLDEEIKEYEDAKIKLLSQLEEIEEKKTN